MFLSFSNHAQENIHSDGKRQSLIAQLQFTQIKDAYNYGLVFSGPALELYYSNTRPLGQKTLNYQCGLGFGLLFNKDAGFNARFTPLKLALIFPTPHFSIGPYLSTHYQWQLYPEVQSGHMFWFTSMEIGPQLSTSFPLFSGKLELTASTALAGLTSRPSRNTETYFYSLRLGDFIKNAHNELDAGTLDQFNHSVLKLGWDNQKALSFAYSFEYFGYFRAPKINIINHAFHIRWKFGKS
jgi:hypothetical protein